MPVAIGVSEIRIMLLHFALQFRPAIFNAFDPGFQPSVLLHTICFSAEPVGSLIRETDEVLISFRQRGIV
jgi:hypothetical protein